MSNTITDGDWTYPPGYVPAGPIPTGPDPFLDGDAPWPPTCHCNPRPDNAAGCPYAIWSTCIQSVAPCICAWLAPPPDGTRLYNPECLVHSTP